MRPEPEILVLTTDAEGPTCESALHRAADAAGMVLRRAPATARGLTASIAAATASVAGAHRTAAVAVSAEALGLLRDLPPGCREPAGLPVAVVTAESDDPRTLRGALAVGATEVIALDDDLGLLGWLRSARDLDASRDAPPGRVLAVRGVTGGVGASCLAVAVARAAGQPGTFEQATLVDADPAGAVELLLGEPWGGVDAAQTVPGWARLADLDGQVDPVLLHERLPREGPLAVVGHGAGERIPVPRARLDLVVSGVAHGGGLVVVDLPALTASPAASPAASLTTLPAGVDDELWLAPCTVPGVEAAARWLRQEAPHAAGWPAPSLGAGRPRRRWLVARRARAGLHPLEVADALGLPLAGAVAHDRRLDEHVALGLGITPRRRSAYARAARDVLETLQQAGSGASW